MPRPFAERLLSWFDQHGRHDLPWQQSRSPYRVWISEIMLQQTQVATVIPYFERFMARFPTLEALAAAPLDDVLHHWSGLGYYARARNLHRAAQLLVERHGGEFPPTVEAVAELPGIGRSTAGAILALSRNEHASILDGNVKRVLTRHRCIEGWPDSPPVLRALWQLAAELTPRERVADYTQAIMDLGATCCVRSRPTCEVCPVAADCLARERGEQLAYPTPKPRKPLPKRSTTFLLLQRADDGALWLEQRPAAGLWGGLWGFPEIADATDAIAACERRALMPLAEPRPIAPLVHTFTHFQLQITPLVVPVRATGGRCMESPTSLWYKASAPSAVGLPRPVQELISRLAKPAEETP